MLNDYTIKFLKDSNNIVNIVNLQVTARLKEARLKTDLQKNLQR